MEDKWVKKIEITRGWRPDGYEVNSIRHNPEHGSKLILVRGQINAIEEATSMIKDLIDYQTYKNWLNEDTST